MCFPPFVLAKLFLLSFWMRCLVARPNRLYASLRNTKQTVTHQHTDPWIVRIPTQYKAISYTPPYSSVNCTHPYAIQNNQLHTSILFRELYASLRNRNNQLHTSILFRELYASLRNTKQSVTHQHTVPWIVRIPTQYKAISYTPPYRSVNCTHPYAIQNNQLHTSILFRELYASLRNRNTPSVLHTVNTVRIPTQYAISYTLAYCSVNCTHTHKQLVTHQHTVPWIVRIPTQYKTISYTPPYWFVNCTHPYAIQNNQLHTTILIRELYASLRNTKQSVTHQHTVPWIVRIPTQYKTISYTPAYCPVNCTHPYAIQSNQLHTSILFRELYASLRNTKQSVTHQHTVPWIVRIPTQYKAISYTPAYCTVNCTHPYAIQSNQLHTSILYRELYASLRNTKQSVTHQHSVPWIVRIPTQYKAISYTPA